MEVIKNSDTFFVNVDTQKDFMDKSGSLYVDGAEGIKPKLKEITEFASSNGFKVLNTMDYHYPESEELSDNPDFIDTYPPHCIAFTDGVDYIVETVPTLPFIFSWEINYDVEHLPNNRNIVIQKDWFDLATNPNSQKIINKLKQNGMSNAIVYGVVSEVCVRFAVNFLLDNGIKVNLVKDATMYLNEEEFNQNLAIWSENENFCYTDFDFSI